MPYGFGSAIASAEPDIKGDLALSAAEPFWWAKLQRKVFIQSLPDTGPTIYGQWNHSDANTDLLDFVLSAGCIAESPDGISVEKVTLIAPDGLTWTYGVHFTVRGFR